MLIIISIVCLSLGAALFLLIQQKRYTSFLKFSKLKKNVFYRIDLTENIKTAIIKDLNGKNRKIIIIPTDLEFDFTSGRIFSLNKEGDPDKKRIEFYKSQ